MNKINIHNYRKIFFFTFFFIFFLTPYYINLSKDNVSVNYIFVIFPILIIFLKNKIKRPQIEISLIFLFYILLFFISIFFKNLHDQYFLRRLSSFFIFLTIFSYLFIDIDKNMIKAFKIALLILAIFKGVQNIYFYYIYDGQLLLNSGKAIFGSQRFGFVYILSLWILIFYKSKKIIFTIVKSVGIAILLVGILLTYSRTSVLALLLSFFLFFFLEIKLIKEILKKNIIIAIFIFFILIVFFFILMNYFSSIFNFYNLTIINFIFDGFFFEDFINVDTGTSVGYRIFIFNEIINFLSKNPIFGSGYLGCWIFFVEQSCSAHNQYLDVMLRIGFIGSLIYFFLLFKITKFLYINHKDFFYGFTAILIYGLFHETFKLSHGAFILAFMMSLTYSKKSIRFIVKN